MHGSRIRAGEGWTLHTGRRLAAVAAWAHREGRLTLFLHDLTVPSGHRVLLVSETDEPAGPPFYVRTAAGGPAASGRS
jgi:hypothetical protein